jgi:hypothetical protein
MTKLLQNILILSLLSGTAFASSPCYPEVSPQDKNYIIGYGSLMQKESRKSTNPNAKNVYPIEVKGFKRVWGINGGNYRATFLTLIKDKEKSLNAVYYPIAGSDILEIDKREMGYCRVMVPENDIEPLGINSMPDGKYWVYAQKDSKIDLPNQEHPIAQSYVDIFLDGCIQVGTTYNLPDFLDKCISQTYEWPTENNTWVNDRLFPRRPFRTPNAFMIDDTLSKIFDNYYQHPVN